MIPLKRVIAELGFIDKLLYPRIIIVRYGLIINHEQTDLVTHIASLLEYLNQSGMDCQSPFKARAIEVFVYR